jgi:cyclophilin family peptidyl-prolyl cis-trans isomerase
LKVLFSHGYEPWIPMFESRTQSTPTAAATMSRAGCALRSLPRRRTLLAVNLTQSVLDNSVALPEASRHERSFATGTRGSRGHGWYVNYRAGKGERHLQGEYHDRESPQECAAWNEAVLQLGSTKVYLDIVAEPRRQTTTIRSKKMIEVPPLDSLQGEKYRIEMEIASTVMPETTRNFMDLMAKPFGDKGYLGTRLYRIEKNVGLYGGDVLTNTGKTGKAALGMPLRIDVESDPLPLWHIPGTITMLVPKVGEIDSRFLLCTQAAPHIDGICRAFGRMTEPSLEVVRNWQLNLLTREGIPTAYDLIVVECGQLMQDSGTESIIAKKDDSVLAAQSS